MEERDILHNISMHEMYAVIDHSDTKESYWDDEVIDWSEYGRSKVPMTDHNVLLSRHNWRVDEKGMAPHAVKNGKGSYPLEIANFLKVNPWVCNEEDTSLMNVVETARFGDWSDIKVDLDGNIIHQDEPRNMNFVDGMEFWKETMIECTVVSDMYGNTHTYAKNPSLYTRIVNELSKCKSDWDFEEIMDGLFKIKSLLSWNQIVEIRKLLSERKRVISKLKETSWLNSIYKAKNHNHLTNIGRMIGRDGYLDEDSKNYLRKVFVKKLKLMSIKWTGRKHPREEVTTSK